MTARIVTGFELADSMQSRTRDAIAAIQRAGAPAPGLALLLTEGQVASQAYARRLQESAAAVGIPVYVHSVAVNATRDQIHDLVDRLNIDASVAGILPLLPLPPTIPVLPFVSRIDPLKDVDGLHPLNAGLSAAGAAAHVSATALAAVALAEALIGDLRGTLATVVGASGAVGRPLAQCLLNRGATVTIAHVDTRDLVAACRNAELLFVAAGKAGLIGREHICPGAAVIDIGINALPNPAASEDSPRVVGDVDLEAALDQARWITAVPDGVGPVTAAQLMANVVQAAQWLREREG
ncbi:MAG: bifunctional 5,10-methylenetetrahydrofolate dehydrogenase/5,10-methenyltetrahydrofolate cyclohydrolase [Gammaproteobacteria bacterium]